MLDTHPTRTMQFTYSIEGNIFINNVMTLMPIFFFFFWLYRTENNHLETEEGAKLEFIFDMLYRLVNTYQQISGHIYIMRWRWTDDNIYWLPMLSLASLFPLPIHIRKIFSFRSKCWMIRPGWRIGRTPYCRVNLNNTKPLNKCNWKIFRYCILISYNCWGAKYPLIQWVRKSRSLHKDTSHTKNGAHKQQFLPINQ